MKKALLTVLATIGVAIALPATVAAAPATTDITGVITNGGSPVSNAKVNVVCSKYQDTDMTDSTGSYLVQFLASKCPAGSKVNVTATTKNGLTGIGSGTVNRYGSVKLNVAIVNVSVSVPEMGALTGSAAAIAAGGALFATRRRNLAKK